MRSVIYFALALLLGPVLLSGCSERKYGSCYELPNGVRCKWKSYGATLELFGCNDGKRYTNPEWTKEIHVCE